MWGMSECEKYAKYEPRWNSGCMENVRVASLVVTFECVNQQ